MAVIVRADDAGEISERDIATKVATWIRKCEKTIDFVHNYEPSNLSVLEALQGDPSCKISDPYGYISEVPLSKKVENIVTTNGKPVKKTDNISGQLVVNLTTGEELSGRWVGGKREGLGLIIGPRLEKIGVENIFGQYEDGILTGKGKVTMNDDSVREGWFQHGFFHGPARGCHKDGKLNFIGHYKAGLPCGTVWTSLRGGGWMVGCVDTHGQYSGPEIAFLYPDFSTALYGQFENGVLLRAKEARLSNMEMKEGVLCPSFEIFSERSYCYWPSTADDIKCPPLQQDPYESSTIMVGQSLMEGGGDGAYAKKDIPAGTLVAYYNGIRLKAGENSPYYDTGYAIYVEWNRKSLFGYKNGEHMDLPPKYQSYASYQATLAHKLNHSFTPNCTWANADHPCFGFVPSIVTIEEVKAGEELTIHYMMDMGDAPEWYMECWDLHSNAKMTTM